MIREFYRNEIWFKDVRGKRRVIAGLPLPDRLRFLELRARAWEIIQNNADLTSSLLYDSTPEFRDYCDEMLSLCSVDPRWCDWQIVLALLFRHESNDGLIIQQEFPATDPNADVVEDPGNPYHRAIASLMLLENTNYEQAKQIVNSTPWDELQSVLERLAELRSGKTKSAEISDEDVYKAWGFEKPTDPNAPPISIPNFVPPKPSETPGFVEVDL